MAKKTTYDTLTASAMSIVLDMAARYAVQVERDLGGPRYKQIQRVKEFIKPFEANLQRELKKLTKAMEEQPFD